MVSVVIPTYNRASTIKVAVLSVLNQSYSDLEVIVVDDGSIDNTNTIVNSINDSRIHYYYQQNTGACAARNLGVDKANGDYIAFHDSDDLWLPNKLQKQMECLLREHADVVFCKMSYKKDEEKIEFLPNNIMEGFVPLNADLFGIGTQTLLGKREVFVNNHFDIQMPRLQDFELILRLLNNNYKIYCMDEALVEYRLSADSISRNDKKLINALNLIKKNYPEIKVTNPIICRIISNLLMDCARRQKLEKDHSFKTTLNLSKSYDNNLKNRIKACLILFGLY